MIRQDLSQSRREVPLSLDWHPALAIVHWTKQALYDILPDYELVESRASKAWQREAPILKTTYFPNNHTDFMFSPDTVLTLI